MADYRTLCFHPRAEVDQSLQCMCPRLFRPRTAHKLLSVLGCRGLHRPRFGATMLTDLALTQQPPLPLGATLQEPEKLPPGLQPHSQQQPMEPLTPGRWKLLEGTHSAASCSLAMAAEAAAKSRHLPPASVFSTHVLL